jgi:hypothetical protein
MQAHPGECCLCNAAHGACKIHTIHTQLPSQIGLRFDAGACTSLVCRGSPQHIHELTTLKHL